MASRRCLRITFLFSGENKNDNRIEYKKCCLVFVFCVQKSIGLKHRNLSGWNPGIYRAGFPQTKKCAYRFVTVGAL